MHRLPAAAAKTGWTIRDSDRAIAALRPRENDQVGRLDLTDEFLVQLSRHRASAKSAGAFRWRRCFCWWAPIDTHTYTDHKSPGQPALPSLYAQLFRNKKVLNPLEDSIFPEDAQSLRGKILDHVPAVIAALRINAADLMLLVNEASVISRMASNDQIPDDTLSLDNLSSLHRHTTLAKALKLSVQDFLSVKALIGSDPFASTQATLRFVKQVEVIRSSGFSIAELDYLLRHRYLPSSGIAPTNASITLVLAELSSGLQKIGAENIIEPHVAAEVAQTKLIALQWDKSQIDPLVALLDSSATYSASLKSLPQGISFPPESLNRRASYDRGNQELSFKGLMAQVEKAALLALSNDADYRGAVHKIFDAQRTFLTDQAVEMLDSSAIYHAPLNALPHGVDVPILRKESKGRASYDPASKQLHFSGVMTLTQKSALLNLSTDQPYRSAVEELFTSPRTQIATQLQQAAQKGEELDDLLDRLQEHIRRSFSEGFVIQHLAEALKLEEEAVGLLLSTPYKATNGKLTKVMALLRDIPLNGSHTKNSKDSLTADVFPDQFNSYTLMHKAALVISKLKISPKELMWILHNGIQIGWLDLASLPFDSSSSAPFGAWERLVAAIHLRDNLPAGELVLFEQFALAAVGAGASNTAKNTAKQNFFEAMSRLTNWPLAELEVLLGRKDHYDESGLLGLSFPGDYQDERWLARIQTCLKVVKRLGASAKQAGDWRKADIDLIENDARDIKSAAKAKYEEEEWLKVAKPLRDALREQQREALVAHLLHVYRLRGPNDLYEHFLIDVEMDPCQMTTRVKQAISSVQLFMQRCQMNLEPGIAVRAEDVRRWKWMKNYRVWEANRKVFIHPENWIEPELRDDKSPFFKELENELMQNDITMDTAETALQHYLDKLDEVARLEVCGLCIQNEADGETIHVFGRTRGVPHVYYYRRWVRSTYWTAWEKVDADIEGDHLIPVFWNRRLYLFWPVFSEKLKKPVPPAPAKVPTETTRRVTQWTKWGSRDLNLFFGISGDMSVDSNKINVLANGLGSFLPPVECMLDQGFQWDDGGKYELRLNLNGSRGHGAHVIGQPRRENNKVKANFHVGIDCTQSTLAGWVANKASLGAKCTSTEAVGSASVQFRVMEYMEYKDIKEPVNTGGGKAKQDDPGIETDKHLVIHLAWSEYRNRKWSGKKLTPKPLQLEFLKPLDEPRKHFTFRVLADNPLTIGCYRTIKPALPPRPTVEGEVKPGGVPPGGTSDTKSIWQLGEYKFLGSDKSIEVFQLDSSLYDSISPEPVISGAHLKVEEMMVTQRDPLDIEPGGIPSPILELQDARILQLDGARILSMTPSRFRLLFAPHGVKIDPQSPFFYQDNTRTFFVAIKTIDVSTPHTDTKPGITPIKPGVHLFEIDHVKIQFFDKFQKLGIGRPGPRRPPEELPVVPPGGPRGPWSQPGPAIIPGPFTGGMGRPTAPPVNPVVRPASAAGIQGVSSHPSTPLLPEKGSIGRPNIRSQPLTGMPVRVREGSINPGASLGGVEHASDLPEKGTLTELEKFPLPEKVPGGPLHPIEVNPDIGLEKFPLPEKVPGGPLLPIEINPDIGLEKFPLPEKVPGGPLLPIEINTEQRYQFQVFYHPFVGEFIRQLNRSGIPGLLDPAPDGEKPELRRQRLRDLALYRYNPNRKLVKAEPYLPEEQIDFSADGPYSLYNWELFFHIPLLIAVRLSQNQRFEEAQQWFHFIFDPMATDSPDNPFNPGPERFWKFKPFYDETKNHKIQTIQELTRDAKKLEEQVKEWQADPFKPHLIARLRLVAYQKTVVMKYVDNLITWGDQLFRRDTL